LLFLIKIFFYKMHKMLTAQRDYLQPALLIILITNVKTCWEHLNGCGEGSRFLFYFLLSSSFEPDVYALCLHYSNKEAVLFACLSSGWATAIDRLLGPKMGNSIKCLAQGHSDNLSHRESNQRLLAHLLSNLWKYNRNEVQSVKHLSYSNINSVIRRTIYFMKTWLSNKFKW